MKQGLVEQLKAYGQSDYYPFHMPGHKRNPAFVKLDPIVGIDITEIDGFDNLHRPEGVILEAQQRAATLYGACETRFLVNGSSAGNMAAVLGCLRWQQRQGKRTKLLAALNCHKSVYHALDMGGYDAVYLEPQVESSLGIYGRVTPESVEAMLRADPEIGAVIITSPTYEGIVSDISGIAQVVHAYQLPLIVDEAHGAHFGFEAYFPETAVRQGADLVIQSLHKTLPSMTQTALLHIVGEEAPWKQEVLTYYSYLQTSSPSYVMMAGMDACMALLEASGPALFASYRQKLEAFYRRCLHFKQVGLLRVPSQDPSKLVIYLTPVRACGKWLYDLLLNKYHLQMEMASRDYVLAMTSICDSEEGFDRLYEALAAIVGMTLPAFPVYPCYVSGQTIGMQVWQQPQMSVRIATDSHREYVAWEQSIGRISAEFAYVYPPGVPVLNRGQRICATAVEELQSYMETGFAIEGLNDMCYKGIEVVIE